MKMCFRLLARVGLVGALLSLSGFSSSGWAAEPSIAILNLSGRRVDPAITESLSHSLREAFLMDGRFAPMDELEMYRILSGPDGKTRLKEARVLLAEGKKLYHEARFGPALEKLELARSIHRSLYSELGRAAELADLLLYQGLTQHRLALEEAAKISFVQAFVFNPDLDPSAMRDQDPQALALIDAAQRQERFSPARGFNPSFASEVARKLKVQHLLVGSIDGGGRKPEDGATITLQVIVPGKPQPEATLVFEVGSLVFGAPPVSDDFYARVKGVCTRHFASP